MNYCRVDVEQPGDLSTGNHCSSTAQTKRFIDYLTSESGQIAIDRAKFRQDVILSDLICNCRSGGVLTPVVSAAQVK